MGKIVKIHLKGKTCSKLANGLNFYDLKKNIDSRGYSDPALGLYILKTIKNATDIQVISTFQGHLVHFVYREVSLPLARESFSKN